MRASSTACIVRPAPSWDTSGQGAQMTDKVADLYKQVGKSGTAAGESPVAAAA